MFFSRKDREILMDTHRMAIEISNSVSALELQVGELNVERKDERKKITPELVEQLNNMIKEYKGFIAMNRAEFSENVKKSKSTKS